MIGQKVHLCGRVFLLLCGHVLLLLSVPVSGPVCTQVSLLCGHGFLSCVDMCFCSCVDTGFSPVLSCVSTRVYFGVCTQTDESGHLRKPLLSLAAS